MCKANVIYNTKTSLQIPVFGLVLSHLLRHVFRACAFSCVKSPVQNYCCSSSVVNQTTCPCQLRVFVVRLVAVSSNAAFSVCRNFQFRPLISFLVAHVAFEILSVISLIILSFLFFYLFTFFFFFSREDLVQGSQYIVR